MTSTVIIDGLTLDSIVFEEIGETTIALKGVNNLTIENCTFNGIRTESVSAINPGTVSGIVSICDNVIDSFGHNAIQIGIAAGATVEISNNTIINCSAADIEAFNIHTVNENATVSVTDNTFTDCFDAHVVILLGNTQYNLAVNATATVTVTGNTHNGAELVAVDGMVVAANGTEMRSVTATSTQIGHTAGEPVKENETESTYDEVVYCTVCGEELSRETITTACEKHTPGTAVKENVVDSTSTTTGSYDLAIYCTVCGNEIARETINTNKLDEGLTLYSTELSLEAGIMGRFMSYANKSTRNKYAQIYLEIVRYGENGTVNGREKELFTAELQKSETESTAAYYVYYYPVQAMAMADVYTITVIGVTADGEVYSGVPQTTSMKQVVMDKMDAFHKAGETAKAKLCAQLLKYAEEAQKTFNYNTGDMATEGMPAEYTSYIMDTTPELNQTHTIPATQNNIKVYSHELMLESVIEHSILYYMPKNYVASDYYAVFVHKDVNNNKETENKEYRVEFADCETYGTRYIYLKFSSLLANDMRDEVTVTIYHKDGTELMSPYTFTVASLAASKLAANPTLVPAMMNYADCAKEVFG